MKTIIIATHATQELQNFAFDPGKMWKSLIVDDKQIIAIYIADASEIDNDLTPYLKEVKGDKILLYHQGGYTKLDLNNIKPHNCGTSGLTEDRSEYLNLINTTNPLTAFNKAWDFFFREDPDEIKLYLLHGIYGGKAIDAIVAEKEYLDLIKITKLDSGYQTIIDGATLLKNTPYDNNNHGHQKALIALRDALLPEK